MDVTQGDEAVRARVFARDDKEGATMIMTSTLQELLFSFHGVAVRYLASSPTLISPVVLFRQHYRCEDVAHDPLTIQFEEVGRRGDAPIQLSPLARQLFTGTKPALGDALRALWHCTITQDGGCLVVDLHEQGALVIDGDRGTARGYFVHPEAMHADLCASFFHYALAELLKRRRAQMLYASALEYQGRGVLIAGHRGCGRTTAMLALLRAGYRYLSDDHPLLRDDGAKVELLSFPMTIEVTDRTIGFFPELQQVEPGLVRQGAYKKRFEAVDLYPASVGTSGAPAMLLFLQVADMPYSCLEPLSKSQALDAILQQAAFLSDRDIARQDSHPLSKLVQQADCYRLHFGQDVLDLPRLITP
ncbi:MAG: hypothetical protein Q8L74_11025, partial [Nitrospirota bacterium]|nr:hypothetical protein [Nitrospirota bacterium]